MLARVACSHSRKPSLIPGVLRGHWERGWQEGALWVEESSRMNGTTYTADFLSGMSEELSRLLDDWFQRVSNNLGVYFLFCLFGLAILALFLCRSSMQALQTSLFFFVLRRRVWQVFCINKFLQRGPGTLDFK